MAITLGGVTLPADLQWVDEFTWSPVEQSVERGLNGSMMIQEAGKQNGRPITLTGDGNSWMTRSTVNSLVATMVAGETLVLDYHGTNYTVVWRYDETPIDVTEVTRVANPGNDHLYTGTLRLMTVS